MNPMMDAFPFMPHRMFWFAGAAFSFAIVMLFLVPAILMWLWNITVPQVFGLRQITYWQAFRLMIIATILFGGARLSLGM